MAEKGLGTGLSALFGDAAIESEPNDFDYLPIEKVEPRMGQPREQFIEESLEELSQSIREHGIIQPLTVRRHSGGYYQIIAGERRWRAARMAGLREVPARIIDADDRTATELALVENLQREDLNPIEEAKGYRQLMSEYSMTQEDVSKRVGKSRPTVANALRLLSLPEHLLGLVETGELSLSLARTVLALENDEDRNEAALTITRKNLTVREAEALVKKMRQEQPKARRKNDEMVVNYIEEVERRLSEVLCRKVKIVDGKKKGRFELEYYDREDFEELSDALASLRPAKGDNRE